MNNINIRHSTEGDIVTFYNEAKHRYDYLPTKIHGEQLSVQFPTNPPSPEMIEKIMFAISHQDKNWTPDHQFIPYEYYVNDQISTHQCQVCAHWEDELFHPG